MIRMGKTSPPKLPGRPRNDSSRRAILSAALEILAESGYKAVTMQAIAGRSGAGRQTLYRWWRSKAEIVLDAFAFVTVETIATPDTGNAHRDIAGLIEASGKTIRQGSGPIIRCLQAEALIDEEFLAQYYERFALIRRSVLKTILKRGIRRGELPAGLDLNFWCDVVFGALLYRLNMRNAPINRAFGEHLAALLPRMS